MLAIFSVAATAGSAYAQQTGPALPGLNSGAIPLDQFRSAISPVPDAIALLIYSVYWIFRLVLTHQPAATLLAAVAAGYIAIVNIRKQREIARLRETFTTLDKGNWDKDLIEARYAFHNLKLHLKKSGGSIAKYATRGNNKKPLLPDFFGRRKQVIERDTKIAGALYSIMNDYENIAIAVRMDILDEEYLYRWMRGNTISDWDSLSPLITALRHERASPFLYIEFEGLASAWQQGKSYRTDKPLQKAARRISVT
jgi:hypothetical protein